MGDESAARQARLPVPPRICQRGPPRSWRPKNLYVREDHILSRLAALAILLARDDQARRRGNQARVPAEAAELIDHLRASGITLTYDPQQQTLRTGTGDAVAVTVGQGR